MVEESDRDSKATWSSKFIERFKDDMVVGEIKGFEFVVDKRNREVERRVCRIGRYRSICIRKLMKESLSL